MFLASRIRTVALRLPKPMYRMSQKWWRYLRKLITYAYFAVRYPETRVIFDEGSSSGQFGQPELVDDLLDKKTGGCFLDIGANHPTFNNNTAFFEKERGYSGWAFDPLNKYIDLWSETRPRTKFVQCALGTSTGRIAFHETCGDEGWEDQLSYVEILEREAITERSRGRNTNVSIVDVKPLREFDVGEIDFASIDVEGFEEMVLRGMFPEIRPKIILIENCSFPVGSERLRRTVLSQGYRFHSRIRYIDDLFVRED